MSSTNKTTNLELSQFLGSDSPKWLTDYNSDMEKIDTGYQTVKAQADATDLVVGGHTSSISTLQDTVTSQGTAITGLRTDVNGNSGSINTINSLIGNGEPTTTDKTLIGAINELDSDINSMSDGYLITQHRVVDNIDFTNITTYSDLVTYVRTRMQTLINGLNENEFIDFMGVQLQYRGFEITNVPLYYKAGDTLASDVAMHNMYSGATTTYVHTANYSSSPNFVTLSINLTDGTITPVTKSGSDNNDSTTGFIMYNKGIIL